MRLVRGTLAGLGMAAGLLACGSDPPGAGTIEGPAQSEARLVARAEAGTRAATGVGAPTDQQILFGDLHVHSTFSIDAFLYALPLLSGEGAHPPADACDFARWCSGLDFFSINDHAEGLTPHQWQETRESIRECNARSVGAEPDLVAFLGWEWTQTGARPEDHFGHKNVIFPGLEDDEVPSRPISAIGADDTGRPPPGALALGAGLLRLAGADPYADVVDHMARLNDSADCPDGVHVRALPADCRESAARPEDLFRKLDEWGFPSLVIPHGLAWGIHAPRGASLDVQLRAGRHDPDRQRLIEVMSGHGNSEEFRAALSGELESPEECAPPSADFLPCCWRAGEIMRARCGELPEAECMARVERARRLALESNGRPWHVFPDTEVADWLDCGECRDCFKPAMQLRPGQTAQYGAALGSFDATDDGGRPLRYRFGFIASTDHHTARAGTGYKQVARDQMSDARGVASAAWEERLRKYVFDAPDDRQVPAPVAPNRLVGLFDTERNASFLYPGGIVAVHAPGRDRDAIWQALHRREVYGTSGPRILLWFDLLNGPQGTVPMGSEVVLAPDAVPRFEVRAVGARVQKPGCPGEARRALSPARLASLCVDECFFPSDVRHPIEAIEVIRIRPQQRPDEPVAPLIEDPWRRFPCEPSQEGCRVTFEDPDAAGRDSVYYVRALQAATPAVNAANLRTRFDADGNAIAVSPCFGGYRTPPGEDCLAPAEERAWSSPIYVDRARSAARR